MIKKACEIFPNEVAYIDFVDGKENKYTYTQISQEIEEYISTLSRLKLRRNSRIGVNINRGHNICGNIPCQVHRLNNINYDAND